MAQANITSETFALDAEPTEAAFEATLPEIMALPDEETQAVNIDPVVAGTIVLGLLPELVELRPQIEKHLPLFDLKRFDKLKQYLLAFVHAHGLYRGAQVPKTEIAALGAELSAIRDRLLGDAMSLANNGFLDGSRLEDCKQVPGYRALASDILTIVPLFKEHWATIEGKTPVTRAALTDATSRAIDLMAIVGLREQGPDIASEVTVRRAKAFTLFLRTYEDARHAVEYLRRNEGDAAEITPSLYAGRGGRPARNSKEPVSEMQPKAEAPSANQPPPALQINNPRGLPIDDPLV